MSHEHGPESTPPGLLETVSEARIVGETQRGSFDLTAGVRMLRQDLKTYGDILPETKQQVLDEGLSYFVEGVDRAARTRFTFQRNQDGDLVYFKDGREECYMAMLLEGRAVASREAEEDTRKSFLYAASVGDYANGLKMNGLKPGEQHVWTSGYRQDIEDLYGKDFMQNECGMQPGRKMGFIYRAYCNPDGSVTLESQTVDRSDDPELMERVQYAADHPKEDGGLVTMNALLLAYDELLTDRLSQKTYAGRLNTERNENAWQQLLQQQDLIEHYYLQLYAYAASKESLETLKSHIEGFTYGIWAAFKDRLNARPTVSGASPAQSLANSVGNGQAYAHIQQEIAMAASRARQRGEVMSGCGGGISGRGGSQLPEEVFDDTFGESTGETSDEPEDCEFVSKECPRCGAKDVVTTCKNGKYYGACGCVS